MLATTSTGFGLGGGSIGLDREAKRQPRRNGATPSLRGFVRNGSSSSGSNSKGSSGLLRLPREGDGCQGCAAAAEGAAAGAAAGRGPGSAGFSTRSGSISARAATAGDCRSPLP